MDNSTNNPTNTVGGIPHLPKHPHALGTTVYTIADLIKELRRYDDWRTVSVHQYGGDPPILSITDQDGGEIGYIELG